MLGWVRHPITENCPSGRMGKPRPHRDHGHPGLPGGHEQIPGPRDRSPRGWASAAEGAGGGPAYSPRPHRFGPPRFADQRGARAAFTLSFLAGSAFYLLLAAACSPSLPGLALLCAAPLPAALAHGLPGSARRGASWLREDLGGGSWGRLAPVRPGEVGWGVARARGRDGGHARGQAGRTAGVTLGRGLGPTGSAGGPALSPPPPPAAQMVIADLSAPEERPAALGRLGLCFGVGMILGSLLGGTLSAACG